MAEYSVLEYGADPSGKILSTAAIQSAIEDCAAHGGGRVLIPAGVFVSGTIWMRSHVELHLAHGARLQASTQLEDYNQEDAFPQNQSCPEEEWNGKHLFIAYQCEDIAITGTGVIDGSGPFFFAPPVKIWEYAWWEGLALAKDKENLRPGQMLVMVECTRVRVTDVTLQNSTCWCCCFLGCSYVQVRGIQVFNPRSAANTDGIDIDACQFVTVSDCLIDTGDDCIAIRGNGDQVQKGSPICEHIAISNCVLSSGSSVFRLGVGTHPIRHVQISNIVMKTGHIGMNLMGSWSAGRYTPMEDIRFCNISASELSAPLCIHAMEQAPMRGITIQNYWAMGCAQSSIISDQPGCLSEVLLRDVTFIMQDKPVQLTEQLRQERGEHFLWLHNGEGVTQENVHIDSSRVNPALWSCLSE